MSLNEGTVKECVPFVYLISSPHLIYSLSPHSLKFSYFLSNLIFCLALLSIPPHLSRLVPFKIVEASKTVVIIRINPFVNRLYNLTFVDDKKCHISRHFSSIYRVFIAFSLLFVISLVFSLKSNECFRLDWHFSSRFSTQIVKYLLKRNVLASLPCSKPFKTP